MKLIMSSKNKDFIERFFSNDQKKIDEFKNGIQELKQGKLIIKPSNETFVTTMLKLYRIILST